MQYHYTKTYDKENLENNMFNHNKRLFVFLRMQIWNNCS